MKKTLPLIFILILALWCNNGFAQELKFDLKNFKTPNLERNALLLNLRTGLTMNYQNSPIPTRDYDEEQWARNSNGILGLQFHRFFDQADFQQTLNVIGNFRPTYYYAKSKYDYRPNNYRTRKSITKSLMTDLDFSFMNRKYLGKYFIGIGAEANYQTVKQDYSYRSSRYNRQRTNTNYQITIPLSIGMGRIYQVQNARLALYILEDLNQQGKLAFQPNDNIIDDFGKLITQIKSERVFDSRIKRKYELSAIDTFLKEKGLITQDDIDYFTTVADNWLYAKNPTRLSGNVIGLGIGPLFLSEESESTNYYNYDTALIDKKIYEEYGAGTMLWWRYEKPISQQLQVSAYMGLNLGVLHANTELTDFGHNNFEGSLPMINPEIDFAIGYYANSRNSIYGNVTSEYSNKNMNIKSYKNDYLNENTHIRTSIVWEHYFSMRSTITASYNFGFDRSVEGKWDWYDQWDIQTISYETSSHSFDLGYTYDLF